MSNIWDRVKSIPRNDTEKKPATTTTTSTVNSGAFPSSSGVGQSALNLRPTNCPPPPAPPARRHLWAKSLRSNPSSLSSVRTLPLLSSNCLSSSPSSRRHHINNMPSSRTLITIPVEIVSHILTYLGSSDYAALSLVSREFNSYFSQEEICQYAHRIYFPRSTEIVYSEGKKPEYRSHVCYEGQSMKRTGADLRNALRRTRRWMRQTPSSVQIISDLKDGTTKHYKGYIVEADEGVLVYRKDYGTIVIMDLNRPRLAGYPEKVEIDLFAIPEIAPCLQAVQKEAENMPGFEMRLNGGALFLIGTGGLHVDPGSLPDEDHGKLHCNCAVFSVRPHNRGALLCTWTQNRNFVVHNAHNSHYAIAEFGLIEQVLEGVIYSREPNNHSPVARFSLDKKSIHTTRQNMCTLAADQEGRVFYFAFLENMKPIVEVYGIPKLQKDGTYSPLECIKRCELRNGTTWATPTSTFDRRSYSLRYMSVPKALSVAQGYSTDNHRVRFLIKGPFRSQEAESRVVSAISWYITEKPSPRKPSTTQEWRQGKILAQEAVDYNGIPIKSCFVDKDGSVDFEEAYPRPFYQVLPKKKSGTRFRGLEELPIDIDVDYELTYGDMNEAVKPRWEEAPGYKPSAICTLFYNVDKDPALEHGYDDYPPQPGYNDEDFVPAGRFMVGKYVHRFRVGRNFSPPADRYVPPESRNSLLWKIKSKLVYPQQEKIFLPYPSPSTRKTLVAMDRSGDRRWIVYGSHRFPKEEKVTDEEENERIVVVRFDD